MSSSYIPARAIQMAQIHTRVPITGTKLKAELWHGRLREGYHTNYGEVPCRWIRISTGEGAAQRVWVQRFSGSNLYRARERWNELTTTFHEANELWGDEKLGVKV